MIGDLILQRRRALGLSQTELARRTGLSQNYVSKLESGRIELPQRGTLDVLSGALDVSLIALYRAAGVADPLPDTDAATPPRTVTITVRGVEETHELAEIIAYVEAKPERRHQDDLTEWKRTMDPDDYAALMVDIYSAWTSNSTAIRSATARMWHRE
jgi:transcriptional regulator with XRE-family HTH domain